MIPAGKGGCVGKRTIVLMVLLVLVGGGAFAMRMAADKRADVADAAERPVAAKAVTRTEPAVEPEPVHPRVIDDANILAPFGPRLGREADAFLDDLGIDLYIVTSTEGKGQTSIELQADQIFQQRRIGADAPTGGLLIVLNPNLASARIEVGYTLEGGLTDLHMSRIARNQLAPYTSYGIAGMAVMDVLHYLRDQVFLSAALGNLELGENYRRNSGFAEAQKYTSGGAGARTALASQPADADLKRLLPPAERAKYAPAARPEDSVAAFMRATLDLAGDPTLELFTEGSRMMRAYYPLARFEELQRAESIRSSMPLKYLRNGDHVVATSERPAKGFVPVLLHLEDGAWRVDLVETWKNLFFNREGNYYLRNSNTPYEFGLKQFGAGGYHDIAALPLRTSIAAALAALEGKTDTVSTLRRAEIWFRNAFVFPQAYAAYEAARRLSPKDPIVLQALGDRVLYLGFPEVAAPALEKVGRGVEMKLVGAYNDMEQPELAEEWVQRALKENPYDLQALRWQQFFADQNEDAGRLLGTLQTIAKLHDDPERSANPVELFFVPVVPKFEPHTTLDVGGTTVFDHSYFGVMMRNSSRRDVVIESVKLVSAGTAAASGLGDIRDYWTYPSGDRRLRAGETIRFDKQWGFTVDTGHEHVRYTFRTCWHGAGTTVRQCRTEWVDVLP
jgi:tetratricopeptide (TPR) repeat protein